MYFTLNKLVSMLRSGDLIVIRLRGKKSLELSDQQRRRDVIASPSPMGKPANKQDPGWIYKNRMVSVWP